MMTDSKMPRLARVITVLALGLALAGCACKAGHAGGGAAPEVKAKGVYEAGGGYSK